MEDTLREVTSAKTQTLKSLNPCFNGRYSQSAMSVGVASKENVLILVLMEDTLREQYLLRLVAAIPS